MQRGSLRVAADADLVAPKRLRELVARSRCRFGRLAIAEGQLASRH
jgi:hypothetical protein